MADIIDLAQDRAEEIVRDKIGSIQAEIRRQGVIDGFCEDCESLIPKRRLEAAPWVTTCVACQEEREAETRKYR